MKFQVQALLAAGLAVTANAHTIFQKLSINGVEQAQLAGFRAPRSNDPIMDVNSDDIICQVPGSTSTSVVNIPAGAKVGTFWGHVIGGEQYAGDVDHPVAASHKGPIAVYLAKVGNAATTGKTGLKWFKVAHEGLSGGKWAVDTLISNKGWWYFDLPTCLAPGNYLLRAELIALHSAYDNLGAQFYISCVQINVTGGGSTNPSSTVSFPGAYPQDHPGIKISVYGNSGQPDNGGRAYSIPGPAPFTCAAGGGTNPPPAVTTTTTRAAATTTRAATTAPPPAATTLVTSRRPATTATTTTTRAAQQPTKTTGSACQPTGPAQPKQTLYGQCAGVYYTGPTTCGQGTCKFQNPYYSQCLN